jgi:2-oxoglutarate dehydrogenase E2 component (dihydrolipoamide succinyltransferase)
MKKEIEIVLPKLGESIVSATVVQWFKKVGDPVALDEPLLEVSTDKVNSEIPSPVAGVLTKILALVDVEVDVGAPLAVVETSSQTVQTFQEKKEVVQEDLSTDSADILSPAVLRLLKENKISLQEVDKIPHTGQGGRLTKKDVEQYCLNRKGPCPLSLPKSGEKSVEGVERVKMSQMRKAIADNMVRSFYEAPHASLATEVDVTRLVQYIQSEKENFLKQHGVKISITSFVAQAIAKSVQEYPLINSSLEGDTIVMKKFVNLGIAVSVDQGVMVPVIRHCHSLTLAEIAKQVAGFATKARSQSLSPSDVKEGTLTMTNFGMTGTMLGIPIIRYPEVAIVGLGAIVKKVAVMPDDSMAIRSVMWISLTFDHRILDGLYGCGFLNTLKMSLENPSK